MKTKNHIWYGLVAAGLIIVLFLIQYFAGLPFGHIGIRWASIGIIVLMVILSCFRYSKLFEDASFGDVFGNGFRTTAVTVVIFAIFFIVFVQLFPEYREKFVLEVVAAGPNAASTADRDKDIAMLKDNFLVSALAGSLLNYLIPGVLAALLGAALAKKK
ncbi:DUF4199 family protein [Chitinophaga cymbidii]|uniref:DUF4199 domain-containing protein n=1 Tax=Chitinophaga cymbidii TaxID=1096750 RepID=A0A512RR92_9BACT|nr:DUF4199 family protein [Chitinophaga cymbidii]GEP98223.1 hypothetical protein CCY01nite_44830 [Chitinophaga cymbidii]